MNWIRDRKDICHQNYEADQILEPVSQIRNRTDICHQNYEAGQSYTQAKQGTSNRNGRAPPGRERIPLVAPPTSTGVARDEVGERVGGY